MCPRIMCTDLQRNRVNVFLLRHIADDPVCLALLPQNTFHAFPSARYERDIRAAVQQFSYQGEPQAGCSAGNRHSNPRERVVYS